MANKVSKNREKKEKIVAELTEKVNKAKAVVLTDYQGMTHKQIEGLKKALKPTDAELVVTKNTLLKLAFEQTQNSTLKTKKYRDIFQCKTQNEKTSDSEFSILNSEFRNPTATIFAYADPITPLKALAKVIKALQLPAVKFGIVEGQALNSDQVLTLSTLPSREVLIAQLLGQMKAPITGLVYALNVNIQKLVMTLQQIKEQK